MKGEAASAQIEARTGLPAVQRAPVMKLDLSSLASVRNFVLEFKQREYYTSDLLTLRKKKAFQQDEYHPLFTVQWGSMSREGDLCMCVCGGGALSGGLGQDSELDRDSPDRDIPGQRPPRRNMEPGSQTGSDIIQRPSPCGQTGVKTLLCSKLRLRSVINQHKSEPFNL